MTTRMFPHQLRAAAVATVALASLSLGCRGTISSEPPVHLNPNMDNVTRVEAQEPSDFWPDGRGMRPPVEGTVARGELRDDDHLYRGKVNGVFAGTMPEEVPLNEATLQRGQARFNIYCEPCHGQAGLENGGVVPKRGGGSWQWAVPSLHGERQRGYSVGHLYDIVTNGFNTMPAYASQIPVNDRWAIAAYVRALQASHELPVADIPREIATQRGWQ